MFTALALRQACPVLRVALRHGFQDFIGDLIKATSMNSSRGWGFTKKHDIWKIYTLVI
jgi:hypothetical protein